MIASVRNDPFVKLSLSLCAIVIGGTLITELYKKLKKDKITPLLMLPPKIAHHSVRRMDKILEVHQKLQTLKLQVKEVPVLFYITGPPGSGKTELVSQVCNYYVNPPKKWYQFGRRYCTVLTLNATSLQHFLLSLVEVADCLGISYKSNNIDELFPAVLSKINSSQLPWLLVVDNLTEATNSCFHSMMAKCKLNQTAYGAIVVTTQSPYKVENCFHLSPR